MAASKTVLVVDDDLISLTVMKTVLQKEGYRVLTAQDAKAGLTLAEQESPDLAVVDLMLPGRSGFFVLEKLKSRTQSVPRVIMVTADEDERHRASAASLGVDDYLRKPFDAEQLLESARRLCPLTQEFLGPTPSAPIP